MQGEAQSMLYIEQFYDFMIISCAAADVNVLGNDPDQIFDYY